MKKHITTSCLLATLLLTALPSGCVRTGADAPNEAARRYFNAWISTYYPDAAYVYPGIYLLEETPGNGVEVSGTGEGNFVYFDYTVSTPASLGEAFVSTTSRELSQQIGIYDSSNYYGPELRDFSGNGITAGLEYALTGMKAGGRRKCAVPGWLMTNNRHDSEDDYFKNESGTSTIYDIELRDFVQDRRQWERDSISRYLAANFPNVSPRDSIADGIYIINSFGSAVKAVHTEPAYTESQKVYISYEGRLLNGSGFDSASEVVINWGDEYTDITFTEDKKKSIPGFSYGLYNMPPNLKVTVIFTSDWGYGQSWTDRKIPPYSPLRFDFEILRVE